MPLTAETIYGFTNSLLVGGFDNPQPTPQFHWELWEAYCSEEPQVALAAPRGHAKSTAVTHAGVLASVLFRNRDYILIVSDTEGQAAEFLGDIKRELQENVELIGTFGISRFVRDTETDIIVEFADGVQFRIKVKGSEQKVRGAKWRGKRYNLIVGDDLENDEMVMSEDRRQKFAKWFTNALLPAGSDDCIIRIVGTILHMDSLLESLMPQWGASTTHTDGLRHWSTKKTSWYSIRYQGHTEDFSKLLWPEKFSEARYRKIRQGYIEQGNPEGYAREYLNYPLDESTAYFRKSDFPPILNKNEHMEYYVGGDLAISTADSRAYSVFVVAGLDAENILKIVDVIRFRGDSLQIIEELFSLQARYNPQAFFVEKENIARSIGPIIKKEMFERNVFLNLNEDTLIIPTKDKVKRAQSIRARARSGGVQIDYDSDWKEDFIIECIQFPRGTYVDQVDAFAMIGLGLDKMVEVPTNKELFEEEQEEEYSDYLWENDNRNPQTGY